MPVLIAGFPLVGRAGRKQDIFAEIWSQQLKAKRRAGGCEAHGQGERRYAGQVERDGVASQGRGAQRRRVRLALMSDQSLILHTVA